MIKRKDFDYLKKSDKADSENISGYGLSDFIHKKSYLSIYLAPESIKHIPRAIDKFLYSTGKFIVIRCR